ncbi:MAG: XRE family transcriptional regulator [Rhodovibrionaceae bacterium]
MANENAAIRLSESPPIGAEIQRLRKHRGMTLDQLSMRAGVSKSVLSQIERDQTNPTLVTLCRIAEALESKPAAFFARPSDDRSIEKVKRNSVPKIASEDGLVRLDILGPLDTAEWLQWYQMTAEPGGVLASDAHGPNSWEHLSVIAGEIVVETPREKVLLSSGDTARYPTDDRHVLRNEGLEAAHAIMVVVRSENR